MTAIPLRRRLPGASSNLPGRQDPDIDPEACSRLRGRGPRAVPIRSCSRWGLPCRLRRRRRGALLPHRFTLAGAILPSARDEHRRPRSVFCGTFPEVVPPEGRIPAGRYPAPHVHGARTFLPGDLSVLAGAAVRPTDMLSNGVMCLRRQAPRRPRSLATKRPTPPLFGFAPGGVCHAACVAAGAVRSYRTISPLPRADTARGSAVRRFVFCGTVPGVSPAGCYPAPHVHGARTFLPGDLSVPAGAAVRPTDVESNGVRTSSRQGVATGRRMGRAQANPFAQGTRPGAPAAPGVTQVAD